MPWNGSGVFNRSNGVNTGTQVWQDDAGAGVKIRADRHDTHDQDIADGMENTVTRDGQNSPSANLPMGNYRHTGVGNASARNDYAAAGQVQDGAFIWCGTAGGTANAITLTPSPAITAYAAGQAFRWIAGASPNTGAATVAISGLTTKALENDGSALVAGDHAAGKMYEGVYDGTAFQISRVWLAGISDGDVTTAKIADDAVTTVKITDANVTTAKIADNAVTPAKAQGSVNAQTGTSYTLVLGDDLKVVTMSNASANTLTIPTNASVAFATGARIDVVMLGAGTTTITGDTGVTVNGVSAGSGDIDAQYKGCSLIKTGTDTWVAVGAIGTVS